MRRLTGNVPRNLTVARMLAIVCGPSDDSRRILLDACEKAHWIDPDKKITDDPWSIWPIAVVEVAELYDDEVCLLYDEVCSRDILRMLLLLRAIDLGILPGRIVKGRRTPFDMGHLFQRVRAKAPHFGEC